MSEQTDIFCVKADTNWKRYRKQICSSWKKDKQDCVYNKPKYKIVLAILSCEKGRRRRDRLIKRRQQTVGHAHRQHIFTFPLHWKLNFVRLGTRRKNSLKTGHKAPRKAYLCSVQKRSISEAGSNTGIDIYKFKQKMANTLSVMTNVLRNVVSKQRIRYKENGFNLDLAYVCDNIIAMGYPADNLESMYRNRLEDVYKFLEEHHGDHYKIYNLCLERSYDINKFHRRVAVYPFQDHNPPTIELIQQFCQDVDEWLKKDSQNVAAVHCKAGKGRTGTMICCYLLFSGKHRTADEALSCYDEKRTKDRKGVTIPSQRRYVQYFSKLLQLGLPYERRALQFCEIRFSDANILRSQGTVQCSISMLQDSGCTVKVQTLQNLAIDFRKQNVLDLNNPSLTVAGDIKVELKKIFHFWFNTFFVTDTAVSEGEGNDVRLVYTLYKWEIDDAHKDKEHKNFSEDFKVELVFYLDDNNGGREPTQVATSNRLAPNHHRSIPQCTAANVRLTAPITQSNSYTLPQNSSSGSEMNFLCDQKSSSSTSVSSSLGGCGTTDNSNGYEPNSQQRRSCGFAAPQHQLSQQQEEQQLFCNPHRTHPGVAMLDANSVADTSPTPAAKTQSTALALAGAQHASSAYAVDTPLRQHRSESHHPQDNRKIVPAVAATATGTSQRHAPMRIASVGGVSGSLVPGAMHGTEVDLMNRQPSGSLSASSTNAAFNYSSKTSSVSSQSSSAIGDTEEDWESGESSAKQLDHITFLLSTSLVTTTSDPPIQKLFPQNTTSSNVPPKKDLSSSDRKANAGIQHSSTASNSTSTSTSTCTSSTSSTSSSSTFFSSKRPINKSNTSNSSCTNRVVGGDNDDDDVDDDEDDDVNDDVDVDNGSDDKCKHPVDRKHIVTHKKSVVASVKHRDFASTSSQPAIGTTKPAEASKCPDHGKAALVPASPVPISARPKLMHLLMAPKSSSNSSTHQAIHKAIFKRKSSYRVVEIVANNPSSLSDVDDTQTTPTVDAADPNYVEALLGRAEPSVGSFGGVAINSKQKLKKKLKQNKLKLSLKFQWFQSYFRRDPKDFCENFVQQTTSMRRNSICSMASLSNKLSTTTPPSGTPPPTTGPVAEGISSSEQINDRCAASVSQSTSNASIATGDLCEDYYSHICDNQLSFSNSPCKSPRSLADIASSINGAGSGGGIGSSFGSSFVRSSGNTYRERRETIPGANAGAVAPGIRRSNVVIVAAKPAKTHAIGFNVNVPADFAVVPKPAVPRLDSTERDASPSSIYCTPESGSNPAATAAFAFPEVAASGCSKQPFAEAACDTADSISSDDVPSRPQPKNSLNLRIVKKSCFGDLLTDSQDKTDPRLSDTGDSDIGSESGVQLSNAAIGIADSPSKMQAEACSASGGDEYAETKMTAGTCVSTCSNSSSSGFCTSECCTTNSSSSSCNCNPFAAVLERQTASSQAQEQANSQPMEAESTVSLATQASTSSQGNDNSLVSDHEDPTATAQ